MTSELLLKPRQLRIEDLSFLHSLGHIDNDMLLLQRSARGYKLKTPIQVPLERILAIGQVSLAEYILKSLLADRPRLIPFVIENETVVEVARYLLRYRTGSTKTFYVNVDCLARYVDRIGITPNALLSDLKDENGLVRSERIPKHIRALGDYVGELQDKGLAPSRIANYVKAIRLFYRVNEVEIKLPYALSRRSVRKDRSPKPEELSMLLDVADVREKVMLTMFALGGFREGTLVRLQYRHVRYDLERNLIPVHVHVEAEITKGKYHDYDTFLGAEAADYLRLYLEARRNGNLDARLRPEEIHDDSPVICDIRSRTPRAIAEKQVYKSIHQLYFKTGLLREGQNGGYTLRVHSLRKFFKTQLEALGVNSDYIEYMMGHTVSTYHDIQSKGVEFLREVYAAAGLSIRPKVRPAKIEMLKAFTKGLGLDPDKILTQEALSEPHRIYLSADEREDRQIVLLSRALKESLRKELATQ